VSEIRFRSLELRSAEIQDGPNGSKLVGVTAPYGVLSSPITERGRTFQERLRSGAFDKSLAENNIEALWEHNKAWLLGTTKSGTARLRSEADGIHFEIDLPNTTYANDLKELNRRGEVRGASFGYLPSDKGETWTRERGALVLEVSQGDLREITITRRPVYQTGTSAYLRSVDAVKAREDLERSKRLFSFCTLRLPPRSF
jgi:HK97 family phage prohead protease